MPPSQDMPPSEAFVPSIDGKFYRLAYWAVDSVGNLTGIGVMYQSRHHLPHPESATPFEGTLAPATYALAETDEVDFVVKTADGKFYRIVSWVADKEGNLVCRGSVYNTRKEAEDDIDPEYFQGTLAARDVRKVEKQVEQLIVASTDGFYYRLVEWEIDSAGNATGVGYVFPSEDDAKNGEAVDPFHGTVAAEDIISIEVGRTSVVGTVFLSLGILAGIGAITLATLLVLYYADR